MFEDDDANWIDILNPKIKKYNNTVHSSTKMTPIQASKQINEMKVLYNLQDKRKKTKFKLGDLIRIAGIDQNFSKSDTKNWSYNLYRITGIIGEIVPTYLIDFLPERYSQSISKKSKLTLQENDQLFQN